MTKTKTKIHEWIRNPYNEYMEVPGVLVSYNPNVNANPLARIYNNIGTLGGIKTPEVAEETALKIDGKWYVLNGDYRKEYATVFPDKVKLLEIYKANADKRSDWSTDNSKEDVA